MKGKILPIHLVGWSGMKSHWWQFVIIGVLLACIVVGSLYIIGSGLRKVFVYLKSRARSHKKVHPSILRRLEEISSQVWNLNQLHSGKKPSSFGVYLGSFSDPLTEEQERILQQWDILIVDPFEENVLSAISRRGGARCLGRLDLESILSHERSELTKVERIGGIVERAFSQSTFYGVLFANWEETFSPSVQEKLFEAVSSLGLAVYLETQGPEFLTNRNSLQNHAVSGLVIRNATIMPQGEKRDYFQMTNLQPTIKAFVSEACMRDFVVLAWETTSNDVSLSNAVDAELNKRTLEPLPAFSWLKEPEVMKAHEVWRSTSNLSDSNAETRWSTLADLFPAIHAFLESRELKTESPGLGKLRLREPPNWVAQGKSQGNPLSISMSGQEYDYLGCFPLGSNPTTVAFAEISQSQQRLRSLSLLHPVPRLQILEMGTLFGRFAEIPDISDRDPQILTTIRELADLASKEILRVSLVLDSGLTKAKNSRFWAVYQVDSEGVDIFVSKNAQGLVGTVLHTFLSAKGFPRDICFEMETALAAWSHDLAPNTHLPRRLIQDIDSLSPEERLLTLQHLSLTDAHSSLSRNICAYIRRQLIDGPSFTQLKELNTIGYLQNSTTVEELVRSRVEWQHREDQLAKITEGLSSLVQEGFVDPYVDMVAMAIFCAARKGAFDEIFEEVTDRNPLFNQHPDQAAAFAESFALGSRCDAYFDVSPSDFGKLLSDRFRAYYMKHQPPSWINGAPQMATSYAGAQIDVNPEDKTTPMRGYQRFTFLSVFAIPALIDILLLTIIGRGLYLSSSMSLDDQSSATMALMISLLLSGAIGTWIACGGPYYLISMAFAAANMFVLIRLIAGIAFTVAGGLIGFVAFSAVKGPKAGIIFYLYLVALTTYFSTFASLASFSYPGSTFLSGRKAIILCIPILFLGPIVTPFSGHDVAIYLAIIYVFIGVLLLSLRSTMSKWVTWYQSIRHTDDTEIRKWYISAHGENSEKVFANLSDPAALKLSRKALLDAVMTERSRAFFVKGTKDSLVKELARDWESTNFLLDWYCRYADVPRPIPFSSGWNIQTKVALDTLRSSQKGLRLHNAFIHWRQSSQEIGCGVLYFVLALLDKWITLLCGDHLLALTGSLTDRNRKAVGFALAYYLIGAVLIDTKAQELHTAIGGNKPSAVKVSKDIHASQKRDVQFRRKVYWRTLFKFLLWHVWSLALSTTLLWIFQESEEAMIEFFAYIIAYTGLIWYQYTKIFTGPHALKPLLVGLCVGLPVGISLKLTLPQFPYSEVIGLGAATWTVAILALFNSRMGMPPKIDSLVELGKTFHAFTTPWSDPEWSQQELQSFFDRLSLLAYDCRYRIDATGHPAVEIKSILRNRKEELRIQEAFPNSRDIVESAIFLWENGEIEIEIVPSGCLGPSIQALASSSGKQLHLAVSLGGVSNRGSQITANCQIIAETLVHAVAEMIMGIPHEYAVLTESIVSGGVSNTMAQQLREEPNPALVVRWAKNELLRQLCLGFEPDIHWDKLPVEVRELLLSRCLGEQSHLSEEEHQWLEHSLCQFDTNSLDVHVARCNLGAVIAASILDYAHYSTEDVYPKEPETYGYIPYVPRRLPILLSMVHSPFSFLYHKLGSIIKFIVIALVADPEFQREFDHVAKSLPTVVRVPSVFILNMLWIYAKMAQDLCLSIFLFHGRSNVQCLWEETKGMTIHIKKSRVIIRNLDGTFTTFRHKERDGSSKVYQYAGEHKIEPKDMSALKSVSAYSKEMLLQTKRELKNGKVINEYHYDYRLPSKKGLTLERSTSTKIPIARRCVQGDNYQQNVQYNRKGLIEAGSYMKDGNLVRFKYHYRKNPQFGDELLRAEFVLSHITCTVAWCAPPRRHPEKVERWIPHSKVTEATFVQGADVFESRWLYDHKFHPTIFTTVNGQKIQTPPMIEHDYLGVLSKPKNTGFIHDNPFFYCDIPVSTSRARSLMWKAWKGRADFDGIIVRWMDDRILRRDRVLAPYWQSRDWGNLTAAKEYMDLRADAIMASADLDDDISSWTPLAVKISDLFNFGPGGDAVVTTRSKDFASDTDTTLHVMAADTGTWPNEGGGVSACRRDMINSLRSIKWHMICESANDFGIPKHQTEQNVQSLKVIPLWGLDFLTPTHGLFQNKLDSEVENVTSASAFDIKINFIPILTALVKGARAVHLSKADIHQATRALVNLNTYFQESRHWSQVWNSETVKQSWRELWLTQEMPNTIPSSQWLDTELPTLSSLDIALELWYRYLFIFSIPVPDKIPGVFQASHHSVSASYGVLCKIKRNCTLQIWDHAISWRETNLCLSSALCKLPPFVRNCLIGLMRVTSVLTLHHADVVLPCADFFNPGWEVEIGTCQGSIEHRNVFRRKVDPVVNGITDMQKFTPVEKIKSERPTVTMLSHVWYAKDIKTALLAADIIINQWKFDDYHLDIYGAIDKAPTYSTECQEIIASKGLRGRVTLRGTADPMKVLENTWLFLNSSLSEGLPLALGEAALTGAPVVCTDVGASLRVLSDPDDFSRFSAVVAPNDALALAKAQISMLAMLGEWTKYAGDTEPAPVLTSAPTPEEVAAITRRMYEKSQHRRELGMKTRQIVQKSFSGDRYLREHEQMLWIGKSRKMMGTRTAGPTIEPTDASMTPDVMNTVEEDIITIPPSAVHSWRSSNVSGMSTLHSSVEGYPGTLKRPISNISALSLANSNENRSSARSPVFAPRHSRLSDISVGDSSGQRSPGGLAVPSNTRLTLGNRSRSYRASRSVSTAGREQLRGLDRASLMQYRNSDVSSIMREEFFSKPGMFFSG
ncbi:hypothetical protein N7470_004970 [Penicillium chermesinum]|nr:hypothetical protein N7470_004970 [Penicillium chermesinum]